LAATTFRNWFLCVEDRVRLFLGRQSWRGDSDLVSFPIATFNRIHILAERTIPSLLSQTHSNIEVVIVADGTPESELEQLRAFDDPRIRIIRLRRRTKYPTDPVARWMVAGWKPRNVGSRASRGDWIYWISDDDFLLPAAVQTLLVLAKNGQYESVSGGYQEGTIKPVQVLPASGIEAVGFEITGPPAWLSRNYVGRMRWNKSSWRKAWDRPSDYDLMKRMQVQGVKFGHTDDLVAVQPEVEGTRQTGLGGSLAAAAEPQ
jgi:glycosyltransferase involved in cell wall biosynthesis